MNELFLFSMIMIGAVFIAACSQILLKREASNTHANFLNEYINRRVIVAYVLFGLSTLVSMYVLRHIPLSLVPVLETVAFIFIPVLSFVFLGEKLRRVQIAGMMIIVVGIIIFSI